MSEPGWIRIPAEQFTEDLKWELVFSSDHGVMKLYKREGDFVCVPRSLWRRLGITPTWLDALPKRDVPEASPISLRPDQVEPVAKTERLLRSDFGTILHASCGKGKTVMALELIRRLRTPTVVLVHKSFLMDQWLERAKEHVPDLKVGIWQRDRVDSGEDYDIVLAMIQSLTSSQREYPEELFASFGFVVTDEVHRFGAPLWQTAAVKFPAKYRLGLTATPERRDGMQIVFLHHIGPIGTSLLGHPKTPVIHRVSLDTFMSRREYTFPWNGEPNFGKLITKLAANEGRTEVVLAYLARAVRSGRKVLVLTERLKHVEALEKGASKVCPSDTVVDRYIGGMNKDALKAAEGADVIIGTYQMAQEGLDIPDLDTLFLATPKTSIIQAVGRILRDSQGKQDPVVVDFADMEIDVCKGMWFARRKRYMAAGYMN